MLAEFGPAVLDDKELERAFEWSVNDFAQGPEPGTVLASITVTSYIADDGVEFDALRAQLAQSKHKLIVKVSSSESYCVVGQVVSAAIQGRANEATAYTFVLRGVLNIHLHE